MSLSRLIYPKLITEEQYDTMMGTLPPQRIPKNELDVILDRCSDNNQFLLDARANPEPVSHMKWIDWLQYPKYDIYFYTKDINK